MKTFAPLLTLILFSGLLHAQYDWKIISYTHSSGSNSDSSMISYTITLNSDGSGKLEYFKNRKTNSFDFRISRSKLNFINSKLNKSGVFKVDPKTLADPDLFSADNIYTMTVSLDREFGEDYEYKFDRSKLPPKSGDEKDREEGEEKEEEEEGEKSQVIPVPNNLKQEYKKQFYELFYDIETIVPNKTWTEADADFH